MVSGVSSLKTKYQIQILKIGPKIPVPWNGPIVLIVYKFIILLDTCNCIKRAKEIVFYLAQFNVTYHLVLGCCTCVMQSFKNKYYVTDDDILN